MRRLISDISGVKNGMTAVLATEDRAALRQQSHVLLGIAGTIGARRVYELAQLLNRCARDETCTAAHPYANELLQRLDGLVLRLRAMASEFGMAV